MHDNEVAINGGLRLLCRIAIADYEFGKRIQGLTELRAALSISKQMGKNPPIICAMFARNYERYVFGALIQILEYKPNDKQASEDSVQLFSALPPLPNLKNAICEEFVRDVEIHTSADDFISNKPLLRRAPKEWINDFLEERRVALKFRMWHEEFATMPKGGWDWENVRNVFSKEQGAEKRAFAYTDQPGEVVIAANAWGDWIAERRIMLDGLRIKRIKLATGVLPNTLPDFGDDSVDPFTEKPLHYKIKDHSFVLYSVGDDLQDNGGIRRLSSAMNGDISYWF